MKLLVVNHLEVNSRRSEISKLTFSASAFRDARQNMNLCMRELSLFGGQTLSQVSLKVHTGRSVSVFRLHFSHFRGTNVRRIDFH